MRRQSVLRGSVWLMVSAVLAKILGALFRIPLTALLGGTGMGYFSCAYGLFLPVFALSVTGINTAVAALTAQRSAQGDEAAASRIPVPALRMFGLAGLVGSLLLFVLAEPLCGRILHNPNAAFAVKMFAPAIFFCCINAVLRGMHEGRCQMAPTAVSQVTEGIGRVCFGLFLAGTVQRQAAVILPHLPEGLTAESAAAAAAILGVTLSTAVGTLTLLCFPRPKRTARSSAADDRSLCASLMQILLPVAAASLVTNLTTLIDLAAGLRVLARTVLRNPAAFGLDASVTAEQAAETANFCYGAFSGMAMTVFQLVPSVTNMLGKGVLPAFAESCAKDDAREKQYHAEQVMRRTAFLAVPAGLGIAALAEPILQMLFSSRPAEIAAAAPSLRVLGFAVICSALSYPLFSMMQAAGYAGDTVTVMLVGAGVKLAGNLLLIPAMQLTGAALSTVLCYAVILLLALMRFRKRTGTPLNMLRIVMPPSFAGMLCAGAAVWVLPHLTGMLALPVSIAAGGLVYLAAYALLRGIRVTGYAVRQGARSEMTQGLDRRAAQRNLLP